MQAGSLPSQPPGKAHIYLYIYKNLYTYYYYYPSPDVRKLETWIKNFSLNYNWFVSHAQYLSINCLSHHRNDDDQVLITLTPLSSFMCISPMTSHLILVVIILHNFSSLLLFSCSVVSDSLRPHGLQHTRISCPSPTPRACLNSSLLSQWYHSTTSFSVAQFSSCLQSSPASGSFPMSWLFASCGQRTGASTAASVLLMKVQDWSPLGWTGWISLQSKGLSRVSSSTADWKHPFFCALPSLWSNSYICTRLLENHSSDYMDLCQQSDVSVIVYAKFAITLLPQLLSN